MKRKYIKGTFATYIAADGMHTVIVPELAKKLLKWGDIPMRISDSRAMEISILADAYLKLRKKKSRK